MEDLLTEARKTLAHNDPHTGYRTLLPLLRYPASDLRESRAFSDAFRVFGEVVERLGVHPIVPKVRAVADSPDDVQTLYDAGYALYEERQFAIAATLLARANRLAPGIQAIVGELSSALEAELFYQDAALLLEASGLAPQDPMCTYLSGFNWFMAGDLERSKERLDQLACVDTGPFLELRRALAGMHARASALQSAGIRLDDRALSAWHAAINGTILLHESPHGYDEPMRGRYAFVGDSPELMRDGLERLASLASRTSLSKKHVTRVVSSPDRTSQILAEAMAKLLGLPMHVWSKGQPANGLVVAWSLDHVDSEDFLRALQLHTSDQVLFTHVSNWVAPFPLAPDLTTFLCQQVTNPFDGGALRVNPETQQVERAAPDTRTNDVIATEILNTRVSEASASPLSQVHEIVSALASLPNDESAGFFRTSGHRWRQRAGSAVMSNRFL